MHSLKGSYLKYQQRKLLSAGLQSTCDFSSPTLDYLAWNCHSRQHFFNCMASTDYLDCFRLFGTKCHRLLDWSMLDDSSIGSVSTGFSPDMRCPVLSMAWLSMDSYRCLCFRLLSWSWLGCGTWFWDILDACPFAYLSASWLAVCFFLFLLCC